MSDRRQLALDFLRRAHVDGSPALVAQRVQLARDYGADETDIENVIGGQVGKNQIHQT